jgi:hypothetical protein
MLQEHGVERLDLNMNPISDFYEHGGNICVSRNRILID